MTVALGPGPLALGPWPWALGPVAAVLFALALALGLAPARAIAIASFCLPCPTSIGLAACSLACLWGKHNLARQLVLPLAPMPAGGMIHNAHILQL